MIRKVVIGTAALMLAASAYAYAQQPSGGRDGGGRFQLRAEDRAAFLDARLAALHAGLKLTPDQEKSWSGFEQSYRALAASRAEAMNAFRNRDRDNDRAGDPITRAQRAADFLTKRGAALKQYADGAAPLYNSLDDAQKQRFEILSRIGRPRFAFFGGDRGDRGGPGGGRGNFQGRNFHGRDFHGGDFRGDRDGFRGEYHGNVPRPRDQH
jgi:zinc resistance-associated protein